MCGVDLQKMKIGITGSSKLAKYLIDNVDAEWTSYRLIDGDISSSCAFDCDVFINQAHVEWEQIELMEKFYHRWKDDDSKLLINISSRASQPNISKGYKYAAQKAALNHFSNNLIYNSPKKFRLTTLNLGLIEDELSSLTYSDIADTILYVLRNDHLEVAEITVSHKENYQSVQQQKSKRYL